MLDAQYMMLMLAKNEITILNIGFIAIAYLFIKKINYYTRYLEDIVMTYVSRNYTISFEGYEYGNNTHYYELPKAMLAISYWCYKNNYVDHIKHVDNIRNNIKINNDDESRYYLNYIIDTNTSIYIKPNIKITVKKMHEESNDQCEYNKPRITKTKNIMTISSKKNDVNKLNSFVESCIEEYDKYIDSLTNNKQYHFIYKGPEFKTDKLQFDINELTDINEDFNCLFHEHKNKIKKDIDRLKDIDFFKKHGLKRKQGYLFYGYPGCGKTYTVMAMAKYDNRHILEIPLSRVKTNKEFEEIILIDEINGVKIDKNRLIILFDEIDFNNCANKRDGEIDKVKTTIEKSKQQKHYDQEYVELLLCDKTFDGLNLGTILSKLDGIGNYNGLIVVATTNCKEKLSPALYRYGRLDPIYFNYSSKYDIKNMIESFYNVKLNDSDIEMLPDYKLAPSMIRKLMIDIDNCKNLIKELNVNITSVK